MHGYEGHMYRHHDSESRSEIYPHYKDMYPGGVKKMTAIDLELSEEA